DEALVVRWFPAEVRQSLVSGEENRLHWSSTPVCLHPAFSGLFHCASPKSYLPASQSHIRQLDHDAADVLVGEEVIPRELHVIEIAFDVEEERIAPPTEEEPVVAGFRHEGFPPD